MDLLARRRSIEVDMKIVTSLMAFIDFYHGIWWAL
jgi:hypothetical protein